MNVWTALSLLSLVGACVLSAGCGVGKVREAAARTQRANDLKQLGLMYHNYHDTYAKPPASAADLAKEAGGDPAAQKVLQSVTSGQYVLIWGVKLRDVSTMPAGSSGTVLGYEANAATTGGNVLMADGSVIRMTAEEFQKAPKATGS